MTRLGVAGALVDGRIVPGDVAVAGGRIVAVGLGAPSGQRLAVAGFVDLQVNGFAGVDLSEADADGYRRAGEALLATGVTAYQPTFITAPLQTLTSASGRSAGSPQAPGRRSSARTSRARSCRPPGWAPIHWTTGATPTSASCRP